MDTKEPPSEEKTDSNKPESGFHFWLETIQSAANQCLENLKKEKFGHYCIVAFFLIIVPGIFLDEVVRNLLDAIFEIKWGVIMTVFLSLVIYLVVAFFIFKIEKNSKKQIGFCWGAWLMTAIAILFMVGYQFYDRIRYVRDSNSFNGQITTYSNDLYAANTSVLDFSNKFVYATKTIAANNFLYRSFENRYDDLAYWGSRAWGLKDWELSKQLLELSYQAETKGDFLEVEFSAILAEDNLMLSNTTNRYQQFRQALADILKKIDDQNHLPNQNSAWNDSFSLGYETTYLDKMIQDTNFPTELKPDLTNAYSNIMSFRNKHGGLQ